MFDSTKTYRDELRFLLKDKYSLSEIELEKILHGEGGNFLSEELQSDIKLLKSGYPLDYIIGYTDFLGLKIDLKFRPLIPRVETEFWTEKLVNSLDKESKLNILDIFCGSGCIGLALLKNLPRAVCTFADVNPDFLLQTEENAGINSINPKRFKLVESDVFENITEKFDLIVANPPYVSDTDKIGESIKHEPREALYANNSGLELIEKFLKKAKSFLEQNGKIFMEFGENQKDNVESVLKKYGYTNWEFHKDQFDKWRWVIVNS